MKPTEKVVYSETHWSVQNLPFEMDGSGGMPNRRRRLVTGECVFIAAEIFSYLPLCQTIRLGAHTQRPKARETDPTDPIDTYILDLKFSREELKTFNPETTLMHSFLVPSGARSLLAEDYQLERIEPPTWLKHEEIQPHQD